jgi:DNA-binding NarL/FixJ family response regulator
VVGAVGNANDLLAAVTEHRPDAAMVDVRMPPGYTDEGLRAAIAIRRDHPRPGCWCSRITLRPVIRPICSAAPGAGAAGIGYLFKNRVGDVDELVDALSRVAPGAPNSIQRK